MGRAVERVPDGDFREPSLCERLEFARDGGRVGSPQIDLTFSGAGSDDRTSFFCERKDRHDTRIVFDCGGSRF